MSTYYHSHSCTHSNLGKNLLSQPAQRAALNRKAPHDDPLGDLGALVVGQTAHVGGFALEVGLGIEDGGYGGAGGVGGGEGGDGAEEGEDGGGGELHGWFGWGGRVVREK